MKVSEPLDRICAEVAQNARAKSVYVVDIDEQDGGAKTSVIFGMRGEPGAALAAGVRAGEALTLSAGMPVQAQMLDDPETEIEYLFDKYLRPYISSHDGQVTVAAIKETDGVIQVRMDGGCSGCPSSIATLKHGIERTLRQHLPWVKSVEAVNEAVEPDFGIKINFGPALARVPAKE